MATRYQFVDDSGETRLAGFLVPEPGGSIPDPITTPINAVIADNATLLFPDGTGEASITPAVGSGVAGKVTVYNETFTNFAQLNAGTGLSVTSDATAQINCAATDGTRHLVAGPQAGLLMGGVHAAPADGILNAGELLFWFDQTNGAGKLMIKAKTANGTVVTGHVDLT